MFLGLIVSTGVRLSIDGTPETSPLGLSELQTRHRGVPRLGKLAPTRTRTNPVLQPHTMSQVTPRLAEKPALPENVRRDGDTVILTSK